MVFVLMYLSFCLFSIYISELYDIHWCFLVIYMPTLTLLTSFTSSKVILVVAPSPIIWFIFCNHVPQTSFFKKVANKPFLPAFLPSRTAYGLLNHLIYPFITATTSSATPIFSSLPSTNIFVSAPQPYLLFTK